MLPEIAPDLVQIVTADTVRPGEATPTTPEAR